MGITSLLGVGARFTIARMHSSFIFRYPKQCLQLYVHVPKMSCYFKIEFSGRIYRVT